MSQRVIDDPAAAGWDFDADTGYWMWKGEEGTGGLWEQNGDDIYYSDGNVGIGTNDLSASGANAKLGVSGGSINIDDDAGISWGGGTNRPTISGNKSLNRLSMYTDSQERLVIDASGNVGIGVSDATDKLHVSAGDSGGTSHSYTDLLVESSTHNAIQLLATSSSEQALWFGDNDNSAAGGISYYHPNDTLTFRAGDATHMTIDADGRVDITGDLVLKGDFLTSKPDSGSLVVAIGQGAGKINQGDFSVAIGREAGYENQGSNGIIINSSGYVRSSPHEGHIYFKSSKGSLDFDPHIGSGQWQFQGGELKVDGVPVTRSTDLIKTLVTLRKATMDETQDIRESLRDAIDELVAGFEQEIAAMPAPDPEASTMESPE